MCSYKPSRFIITRTQSNIDNRQLREEKLGEVLQENITREYTFSINPKEVTPSPLVLILPIHSGKSDYYKVMLESLSTLGEYIPDVISNSLKDSVDVDKSLTDSLCGMLRTMSAIVNSKSWSNGKLNDHDKIEINRLIENLKLNG